MKKERKKERESFTLRQTRFSNLGKTGLVSSK
jgi:hypothetical protein